MKYGKFVTTGYKTFTESEIRGFEKKFKAIMKALFCDDFKASVIIQKADLNTYYPQEPLIITFTLPKVEDERNAKGDRILSFSKVIFKVFKETGFLDTWDWTHDGTPHGDSYKDYKNAPEFQYSAKINTDGKYIPYRCRRETWIETPNSFQYGTDIDDINFDSALRYLANKMLKGLY